MHAQSTPTKTRISRTRLVLTGEPYRCGDTEDPVDLTGHYLNSLLEQSTEELRKKAAELEALCVKQADSPGPGGTLDTVSQIAHP